MACCKDKKLSLFLVLKPEERINEDFQRKLHPILKSLLEWTDFQVEQIIDKASERKDCLVYEANQEQVIEMSKKFAQNGIGHYVIEPKF